MGSSLCTDGYAFSTFSFDSLTPVSVSRLLHCSFLNCLVYFTPVAVEYIERRRTRRRHISQQHHESPEASSTGFPRERGGRARDTHIFRRRRKKKKTKKKNCITSGASSMIQVGEELRNHPRHSGLPDSGLSNIPVAIWFESGWIAKVWHNDTNLTKLWNR